MGIEYAVNTWGDPEAYWQNPLSLINVWSNSGLGDEFLDSITDIEETDGATEEVKWGPEHKIRDGSQKKVHKIDDEMLRHHILQDSINQDRIRRNEDLNENLNEGLEQFLKNKGLR